MERYGVCQAARSLARQRLFGCHDIAEHGLVASGPWPSRPRPGNGLRRPLGRRRRARRSCGRWPPWRCPCRGGRPRAGGGPRGTKPPGYAVLPRPQVRGGSPAPAFWSKARERGVDVVGVTGSTSPPYCRPFPGRERTLQEAAATRSRRHPVGTPGTRATTVPRPRQRAKAGSNKRTRLLGPSRPRARRPCSPLAKRRPAPQKSLRSSPRAAVVAGT